MLEINLGAIALTFARKAYMRLRIGRYEIGGTIPNGGVEVNVSMTASQMVKLHAEGADKTGLDAGEPKVINWTCSDPTLLTITTNADQSCSVTKGTNPRVGAATVTAGDGDDPSVPSVAVDFTVTAGPIAALVVTADPPVEV